MAQLIVRTLEWVVRLLLPPQGRHRATCPAVTRSVEAGSAEQPSAQPWPLVTAGRRSPLGVDRELNGHDVALVRPYLLNHERRRERQRQRERRHALLLALEGIDVGPSVIHGVPVGTAAAR